MPNDPNFAPPAYCALEPLGAPPAYAEVAIPTSAAPQSTPTVPISHCTYFHVICVYNAAFVSCPIGLRSVTLAIVYARAPSLISNPPLFFPAGVVGAIRHLLTLNGMYVSSPPGPWSPYVDGFHTPPEFAPSPQFFAPNPTILPAASFDSMDCTTPSSSPTSSVSDDGVPFSADEPSGNHYSYFNTEPQTPYLSPPYADNVSRSQFPWYSPRVPLSAMPAMYRMTPMYNIFSPKAPSSATFYSTTGFPPELQRRFLYTFAEDLHLLGYGPETPLLHFL
ncbi:hypothetical protein B0H17DRAFT_1217188 [Mycena rosella]|uniref:Uncharacterized protein n=1 Tax=Mycena rosella TaxID=1033263 RepID=A0AAD7FPD8_MYCRO|nr:hypothetical protein B0H17DRAFT_1217188 [Mycena rosella]